jgi:aspartate aminotransferase
MSNPSKIELSRRVLSVAPSATLAITAKAKELASKGIDVVSLSAGEPDFDTPPYIKEACIAALEKGMTRYTPVSGTAELRKAIAAKFLRDQNLTFSSDQVVVGCGAKHVIFNTLFALLNEGDEVAIPSPYWLSYPEMVTVLGGRNIFIETTEASGFKLTPESLREKLTAKTRVLILNSPSNPTGAVYTKDELQGVIRVLRDFPNVMVLSDEIYEKLVFDGKKHHSIASLDPEIAQRTVIVNGHSKAYAMTGWRLGYAACPNKALIEAVSSIQSHSTSNPNSFAQAGGVTALEQGDEDAAKMCAVFEKRRNFFVEKLAQIPQLKPIRPEGAFYVFVNSGRSGIDSLRLAQRLLEEAHVAVVPGKPFGSDQHIRLSFAASEQQLEKAVSRLVDWFKKL